MPCCNPGHGKFGIQPDGFATCLEGLTELALLTESIAFVD
jgi:hypothetical protein